MVNLKVFLSSTHSDLLREREIAQDIIVRLKQQFIGMEFFPASDETPIDVCLNQLDASDIVIFIIGHRYGYIDEKSKTSIVECEFNHAVEKGKRVLVFLKSDDTPIPIKHFEFDPDSFRKLRSFKEKLLGNYHIATFNTPEQLATEITYSLFPIVSDLLNWPNLEDLGIRNFKKFWQNFFGPVIVVMEASELSPHSGESEGGKNINGAAGMMELLPNLAKLGLSYTVENSTQNHINTRGNLILDGSFGGNKFTKKILDFQEIKNVIVYNNEYSEDKKTRFITDGKDFYHTEYKFVRNQLDGTERKEITFDYGYIMYYKNPYHPNYNMLLCSGNHGYGTFACMKVLSSPDYMKEVLEQVHDDYFQVIVGISPISVFKYNTIEIIKVVILK